MKYKIIRRVINKILSFPCVASVIINKITQSGRPRPYPFSLWTPRPPPSTSASATARATAEGDYFNSVSDYTSWVGLFDKTYTKRHLPPESKEFVNTLPHIDKVCNLFRRQKQIPGDDGALQNKLSSTTSLLFPFFAQWFTDSFLRTDYRDWHKNTSNHQIDLCQIYGLNESVTNILRSNKNGKLKHQFIGGEEYFPYLCEQDNNGNVVVKEEFKALPGIDRMLASYESFVAKVNISTECQKKRQLQFFVGGLNRANSTIGYTLMNAIFLRAHNKICDQLSEAYGTWDDERLFQTARNILIVILLKIVVVDYIKHISGGIVCAMPPIGFAEKQKWYRENWIAIEFSLLYRWHMLIPDKLSLQIGNKPSLWFKDFMYNPALFLNNDMASIITSLSQQAAGASALFNTPEFLMPVKKASLELSRNARLAPYNAYREAFGYKKLSSFEELNTTEKSRMELCGVYGGDINKLEFLPGLWAENPSKGKFGLGNRVFGSVMSGIVAVDAFSQALTNPLLSENIYGEKTFSAKGLQIINSINSLEQLINETVPGTAGKYVSLQLPTEK